MMRSIVLSASGLFFWSMGALFLPSRACAEEILWVSGQSLESARLDGSERAILSSIPGYGRKLALDPFRGEVVWQEQIHAAMRAMVLGSSEIPRYLGSVASQGLRFHIPTRKVYLVGESFLGRIDLRSRVPEDVEVLLELPWAEGVFRGLALDGRRGKLYCTTSGGASGGQIVRMELDGTGSTPLISGLSEPRAIEVDSVAGHVYWSDSFDQTLRRARLDGTELVELSPPGRAGIAFTLDLRRGKILGADFAGNLVETDLDGENRAVLVAGANPRDLRILRLPEFQIWDRNRLRGSIRLEKSGPGSYLGTIRGAGGRVVCSGPFERRGADRFRVTCPRGAISFGRSGVQLRWSFQGRNGVLSPLP